MENKFILRIVVIAVTVLLVAAVVVLKIQSKSKEAFSIESGLHSEAGFSGNSLELTKAFDLDALRATGLPVIIDFGADSCIPCKEMAPILVDLHDSLEGKAIIHFIDVWKNRTLANGYPLQVIPTQFFFDSSGKPFTPSESLGIQFTMYTSNETNEHVFTAHEGGLSKEQLLAILYEMGLQK